ncbi:DUF6506 family protein [Pseudonocardia nematodicida]|uniref:DUF6506 family protein n=1 Tax=Pseudonocardia nematodicida TaxID=1206997 RepID=A0ABV1KGP4_9PSEU
MEVARDRVAAVAAEETARGAGRVELCGALGPVPHAAVRRAVGDRAEVGAVMYGFESLEATTSFKQRFAAGEQLRAAFLIAAPAGTPGGDRVEVAGTTVATIGDPAQAARLARELAAEGVELFELHGAPAPEAAAAVIDAVGERVAVGLALYPAR